MINFYFARFILLAASLYSHAVYSVESPVTSPDGLERVTQELVAPPLLPEHTQIAVGAPKVVKIRMTVEEK